MADEETTPTPPLAEESATPPQEASPTPTEPEAMASESVTEAPPVEAQTAQPETQTAQMGRNEPIGSESAPVDGPLPPEPEPIFPESPAPTQSATPPATNITPPTDSRQVASDRLVQARASIQDRKRKKLDKIMESLNAKDPTTLKLRRVGEITNDEVEKLLHVSDATATRYLSALEKEGKIKQLGKTGTGVVYTKI